MGTKMPDFDRLQTSIGEAEERCRRDLTGISEAETRKSIDTHLHSMKMGIYRVSASKMPIRSLLHLSSASQMPIMSFLPLWCRSNLFCLKDADQVFSASRMPIKSFLPPRCRSSLFCFQDADQVFSVSRKPIKSFLPRSCWSSLSCLVDADHSTNALATIKRLTVYCQTFFLKYNILEGCAIHHEVITYSNAY